MKLIRQEVSAQRDASVLGQPCTFIAPEWSNVSRWCYQSTLDYALDAFTSLTVVNVRAITLCEIRQ